MSEVFVWVPDVLVTLCRAGVYDLHHVYEYEGQLFAKVSKGYIRLYVNSKTSVASITWKKFVSERRFYYVPDALGRLILK
jgi:hypothetical protein